MCIDILIYILLAASIICSIINILKILKNKKSGGKILKLILAELCFLLYIGMFILLDKEILATIVSVVLIITVIITTQWQKYQDRRMGKRWWTQ